MKLEFYSEIGREEFVNRIGGKKILSTFENAFPKNKLLPRDCQDVVKRFFVLEPEGRTVLLDNLEHSKSPTLWVHTFDLIPDKEIMGMTLYVSKNYLLKEDARHGFILIEKNTSLMDLSQYEY